MSWVVFLHRHDCSFYLVSNVLDFSVAHRLLKLRGDVHGNLLLYIIIDKNYRGVLRSHVVALSVFRGGVMKHVKEFDQFFEVRRRVRQFHMKYFHVPRATKKGGERKNGP
jgi:hypothetical protein